MLEEGQGQGGGNLGGGSGAGGGGSGGGGGEAMMQESQRSSAALEWKHRAEQAEARIEELEAQVTGLEGELASAEAQIAETELRRSIDRELAVAQAIDLETAALMTEAAVTQMDEPDVASAVADLRSRKPFLFGQRSLGASASAMGAFGAERPRADSLAELGEHARDTGDKRALLRYLRMRRGA